MVEIWINPRDKKGRVSTECKVAATCGHNGKKSDSMPLTPSREIPDTGRMLSPGGGHGGSLCTLTALSCLSCILGACFPQCTCMYIQNQTRQKAILQEVSFGKAQISAHHPRILACVWPSLAATASFQSSRPWSGSELECPARKGAPWRPPERPRLRVVRGGGWGVSRPTDENSKCSPAWAANRFQIGRVRARAAAAWLHKQPVAPDGGWLQPGEQVHGGLGGGGGGSRWRTPIPPRWGREAPAAAHPCWPESGTPSQRGCRG